MTSSEMGLLKSGTQSCLNQDAAALPTPYLKLLYFVPLSVLTSDLQLKDSMFLFPDDATVSGSMSLFRCFLRQLLDKKLVAIAKMQRTAGGEARLVALYPRDEETDADGYMEQPGGLYMITLPFIQEIRNVADSSLSDVVIKDEGEASVEPVTSSAVSLVQALQFNPSFRYTDLESPGVQYFYSMLQAIALAEEKCEWDPETDDMLQPDSRSLSAQDAYLKAFASVTGIDEEADVPAKKTVGLLMVGVASRFLIHLLSLRARRGSPTLRPEGCRVPRK